MHLEISGDCYRGAVPVKLVYSQPSHLYLISLARMFLLGYLVASPLALRLHLAAYSWGGSVSLLSLLQ